MTTLTNRGFIAYRSPPWPWTLADGLVTFLHANGYGDIVLDVISCYMELEHDSSPIGRVKGSALVLRGHLKQASRILHYPVFAIDKTTGGEFEAGNVFSMSRLQRVWIRLRSWI
jgi:hypothetical protein